MTWFGWVEVTISALGALINIAWIGKETQERTPRSAVTSVIISSFFIIATVTVGTGHL